MKITHSAQWVSKQSGSSRVLPITWAPCLLLAAMLGLSAQAGAAASVEREQAKFIHDRLNGTPPSADMLAAMEQEIIHGDLVGAAKLAMDGNGSVEATGNFYTVTLKNWATPWTNEEDDVFAPLNDYSALVIGLVRDELDFRQLLSGDILYIGANGLGLADAYSMSNNRHYEQLERSGANLGDAAVLQKTTQSSLLNIDSRGIAGIFSTRAAAKAFFSDGTNRAMFRFTVRNHLCNDMEQLKDAELPADRIRQDVSRSPGGDSRLFLNGCVACHTGMDPLTQAFAYYDWDYFDDKETGRLVYTPGVVQEKYLINGNNFKPGFVTPDDSWTNHWRQGANVEKLGWTTDITGDDIYTHGTGAASMGAELANSKAFAYCQVSKAFKAVCLRQPTPADSSAVETIAGGFLSDHNLKNVFAGLAATCSEELEL